MVKLEKNKIYMFALDKIKRPTDSYLLGLENKVDGKIIFLSYDDRSGYANLSYHPKYYLRSCFVIGKILKIVKKPDMAIIVLYNDKHLSFLKTIS
jgi:hypothetical protein